MLEKWIQHRLVEEAVIIDPPLHDAVEHVRKVLEGLVTAARDTPGADLPLHADDLALADRRQEAHEVLAIPLPGQPRPEGVSHEREARAVVVATAVIGPATCVLDLDR